MADHYGEAQELVLPAINQLTFFAWMCKVVESKLQFPTFDRILDLDFTEAARLNSGSSMEKSEIFDLNPSVFTYLSNLKSKIQN